MITAVADKFTLLTFLQENREHIRAYGVDGIGLFGSFVRNHSIQDKSDVDLLVDFTEGKKTFRNLMDLGYFLEDLLGRKVELITRDSLSPFIGPHILKEVENVAI